MKTVAISMEESLLADIDRLTRARPRGGRGDRRPNRSEVVRQAVREFMARQERQRREIRDRELLEENRARLQRQVAALVAEQAG